MEAKGQNTGTAAELSTLDLLTLQEMRDQLEARMPGYEELGIRALLDDYRDQLAAIESEIGLRLFKREGVARYSMLPPIDGRSTELSPERARDIEFNRHVAAVRGAL